MPRRADVGAKAVEKAFGDIRNAGFCNRFNQSSSFHIPRGVTSAQRGHGHRISADKNIQCRLDRSLGLAILPLASHRAIRGPACHKFGCRQFLLDMRALTNPLYRLAALAFHRAVPRHFRQDRGIMKNFPRRFSGKHLGQPGVVCRAVTASCRQSGSRESSYARIRDRAMPGAP